MMSAPCLWAARASPRQAGQVPKLPGIYAAGNCMPNPAASRPDFGRNPYQADGCAARSIRATSASRSSLRADPALLPTQ